MKIFLFAVLASGSLWAKPFNCHVEKFYEGRSEFGPNNVFRIMVNYDKDTAFFPDDQYNKPISNIAARYAELVEKGVCKRAEIKDCGIEELKHKNTVTGYKLKFGPTSYLYPERLKTQLKMDLENLRNAGLCSTPTKDTVDTRDVDYLMNRPASAQ